jgi:ammonium transporter, Amt family
MLHSALSIISKPTVALLLLATFVPSLGLSQEFAAEETVAGTEAAPSGVSPEVAYILNSLLFLFCGVLVMFMSAGFAMLEAGMVRYHNVGSIVLKNMALYAIATLMFYFMGYELMYNEVDGGFIGQWAWWVADDSEAIAGNFGAVSYAKGADWFFQVVFVATTASIISGAVAERMKIWTFFVFIVFMTGLLYPIVGAWKWGGGWLEELGFQDFAGSSLVHSVGGWASLVAIAILGPRVGRFDEKGNPVAILPSNIVLVCLGVFILWMGWFGFNGGSQLSLSSGADAIAISNIFINTNMAAAAGVVIVMILSQIRNGKIDVYMALNGALAGLVSITADPLNPSLWQAIIIGAVGGTIIMATTPLLEKMRLDDVVGAVPVHLCCGIWGTMIVPWTNEDATVLNQLIGVMAIAGFMIVTSAIIWTILKRTMGLRVHADHEKDGLDLLELGISGLPYLMGGLHKAKHD